MQIQNDTYVRAYRKISFCTGYGRIRTYVSVDGLTDVRSFQVPHLILDRDSQNCEGTCLSGGTDERSELKKGYSLHTECVLQLVQTEAAPEHKQLAAQIRRDLRTVLFSRIQE